MSSFPSRELEIWRSSLAYSLQPISGAFAFHVVPSLMVPQILEFLHATQDLNSNEADNLLSGFLRGMAYWEPNNGEMLYWWRNFGTADELFAFDLQTLMNAIRQLELHADLNLTYRRVSYIADIGTGLNTPLLIINRLPFSRGVAFEIEERGLVRQSMELGDFELSDKAHVAQQHYSTGMALLAAEDQISGLIDAAFLQFYLCIEALLESHKKEKAVENGQRHYGGRFDDQYQRIVRHVFVARQRFFGHANPKVLGGMLDTETAFDIAKQVLVARWGARALMELELARPLLKREVRLYPMPNRSLAFTGDVSSLENDFALPE